jgi:electron transport complex protein RnfB
MNPKEMDMTQDTTTYERLAQALGRLPNGFPRTPSNVEIDLLEKIFTSEEAGLAAELGAKWEPVGEVAARCGLGLSEAQPALLKLAEGGLVWPKKTAGGIEFRLAPFVVGIYEAQLTRMDPELARLVDAYMDDGGAAGIMGAEPAIHRVIPARAATKPEWILPYDDVRLLLESAKSFRVQDCVCRVQMDQIGRECDFPLRMCVVYYTVERPPSPEEISKEEALKILDEAERIGLVHTVSNVQTGSLLPEGIGYVCNCCGCCCLVMRGINKWGIENSLAHAAYYAVVDPDTCTGCGVCVERCQVGAIKVQDSTASVSTERCIGCGLCVTGCPEGAAELNRKPDEDIDTPPEDFASWQEARKLSKEVEA